MTVCIAIWRWSPDYDNSSKRHRRDTRYEHVFDAVVENQGHPGLAPFDSAAFLADLTTEVGPPGEIGGYAIGRVDDLGVDLHCANIDARALLPRLQRVANEHGLALMSG